MNDSLQQAEGNLPVCAASFPGAVSQKKAISTRGRSRWYLRFPQCAPLAFVLASTVGWIGCQNSPSCGVQNTTITGPSTVAVGSQVQLALGNSCDPSESGVVWSAAPAGYLSVDGNGKVTGISATPQGSPVTITANASSTGLGTFTAMMTVTGSTLQTIAVTDADKGSAGTGATDQFTATGNYADATTQDFTKLVTWTSGTPAVATIAQSTGLATTLTVGTSVMTASYTIGSAAPITGSETLTVAGVAPTLTSIAVSPASASVAVGLTQQYTATGTYSDGSVKTITNGLTWTSSPASVATIDSSSGLATAVSAGSASIVAMVGSVASPGATLTVTGLSLVSLSVIPAKAFIQTGKTQPYTAIGVFSNGTQQTIGTGVVWTASPASVVTIDNNNGLATGVAPGTGTIVAKDGSVTSPPVTITVLPASRYLVDLPSAGPFGVEAIVPGTGQLRARGTAPRAANTFVVLPGGKNIVFVNEATGTLSNYSMSAGGEMAHVGTDVTNPNWSGQNYASICVDPLGRFIYVADYLSELWEIPIDSSGNLGTPVLALSNLSNPSAIAVDPSGVYLYAVTSNQTQTKVNSYTIGAGGTITATAASSVPAAGAIVQLVVSPAGSFIFGLEQTGEVIDAFSVSAGILTSVTGSPFSISSGGTPQTIAIDPTGSYLYLTEAAEATTTGGNTDGLFGFTIATGGQLVPMQSGTSFPVGQFPAGIATDSAGQFLYVANNSSGEIWVYSIAGASGELAKVSAIRTAYPSAIGIVSGPTGLTFTPKQLYVTNSTVSGTITQFTIAPATGMLSNLSAPVASGINPQTVTTDPLGLYAYAGGTGSNDLSGYSISATGLSLLPGSPYTSGTQPTGLTVDLSGSYLYATMQGATDHTVWVYDLVAGVPTNGSAVVDTDAQPVSITGEPSNQFLYVANYAGHSINMYQIYGDTLIPDGSGNGSLSVGLSQNSIIVDPSGRFAYSADPLSNEVWEFSIGTNGLLTQIGSRPAGPSSSTPGASLVVAEPSGKYLYATNQSLSQIFVFGIDPKSGLLTPIQGPLSDGEVANLGMGNQITGLVVDISGKYMYCVYSTSPGAGSIAIYSIDLTSGFLTLVGSEPYVQFATGITTTGTVQ